MGVKLQWIDRQAVGVRMVFAVVCQPFLAQRRSPRLHRQAIWKQRGKILKRPRAWGRPRAQHVGRRGNRRSGNKPAVPHTRQIQMAIGGARRERAEIHFAVRRPGRSRGWYEGHCPNTIPGNSAIAASWIHLITSLGGYCNAPHCNRVK